MKKPLLTIFILVLMVALPLPSFANSLTMSINPPFPEEGERVIVSLSSFLFDLKNSVITWKEDGKVVLQGVGLTSYSIAEAKNQNIFVEIFDKATGKKISENIQITLSEIDLLWESIDSYTPPFYKGKAVAVLEANINVVAIPRNISTQNVSFEWQKDSVQDPARSGRGKNSFSFIASPLDKSNLVSVFATSSQYAFNSQKDVVITYQSPEVVFYEDKGLEGISWNKAVQNGFFVGDGSTTLVAIPYFLSVPHLDSDLYTMKWRVSGGTETIQDPKHKIRLSGTSGVSGKAIVSVVVEHTKKLFEEGEVGVELVF